MKTQDCILLLLLVSSLTCCKGDAPIEKKLTGTALGTSYQILYFGNEEVQNIQKGMDSIFEAVNTSMSTYQKDSDISKINNGDRTVVVDQMFIDVFELSKKIYVESDGFFDPTVGNLVNAYGFGSKKTMKVLDSAVVDSIKEFVGLEKVTLTSEKQIQKTDLRVYLEFNAIAKGYCIDRMATYLNTKRIDNYLIELGGELVAKGNKGSKKNPWLAGIENPNEDGTRSVAKAVALNNLAMATSGNYRKYRLDSITGQKYVHTINPKTGYPEKNDMLSASVFAPTCTEADAYATTFMVLGFHESKKLLEDLENIEAYFMYLNPQNNIETFVSEGIKSELK